MKQKSTMVFLVVTLLILLTGCTTNSSTKNLQAGVQAVEQLKYEEALQYFETAVTDGEDKRLTARGKGLAYMGLTKYEEALAAFEEALSYSNGRVDGVDYDINYYMAVSYYKLGDLQKAEDTYSAIIKLHPKEKETYLLRGIVELQNNQYENAIADFEKAIAMDKTDYETLIDVYVNLEENGYKEAGQTYLNAALKDENKTMTELQAGSIYFYLEDYENARNSLEKARSTGDEDAILFLGKTYEALGDMNYAITVYTEYLEKNPKSIAVSNQLALSKMNMKDYEGALIAIETAMQIENNDMMQVLKFNEIIAYEYLSDFKKATVLMESYLSSYPDDAQAQREYQFLKTR